MKLAKDGTPYPADFDKWGVSSRTGEQIGWGNAARTYWLMHHDPGSGIDILSEYRRRSVEYSDVRNRPAPERAGIIQGFTAVEHVWKVIEAEQEAAKAAAK
jgi:hypothetical protein